MQDAPPLSSRVYTLAEQAETAFVPAEFKPDSGKHPTEFPSRPPCST